MIVSRCLGALALAMGLTLALPVAQAEPLKVEGMQTVYQRVLTKHGTPRSPQPGAAPDAAYNAFLPLYVFARQDGWVQIGAQANAAPEGWVPVDQTIEWRQNIVAAFTNPANRQRQLIFDTEPELTAMLNHENPAGMMEALVREADAAQLRDGTGVVAVEPAEHIDLDQNFYILPILGFFEDFHPMSMSDNLLLNVASLPLQEEATQAASQTFDVGIVLVVDTTMSMEPYFGYTQEALQNLVSRLGTNGTSATHFGIVAFQDNGMVDHIKVALPLERRDSLQPVLDALGALQEARQSSPGYNEDSLGAVNYAMDQMDWAPDGAPFGVRYIVLVTDAGPKLPSNDRTAYQLEAADLQADATDKGFGLVALHIKPARFEGNHDFARAQYEALTRYNGVSTYFGVSGEDPAAFRAEAERIADTIMRSPRRQAGQPSDDDANAPESLLGLDAALRLRYLGSVRGTQAPDVITGWVSQYAVEDPRREAVEFRLLITRNQLATLADLTQGLIDAAEQLSQDEDVAGFHRQIREMIVQLSQNPDRVVNPSAQAPGDALEFLQDLPYRSRVLRTSQDRWMENPGERREIIDGLYSKLAAYKRRLNAPEIWHALFEAAPDGDHVTTIPIQFLP